MRLAEDIVRACRGRLYFGDDFLNIVFGDDFLNVELPDNTEIYLNYPFSWME